MESWIQQKIDKWSGKTFEEMVTQFMNKDNGRLSREDFELLRAKFVQLNMLSVYAVSSWLAGRYPGLDAALRKNDYDLWLSVQ